MLDKFFNIAQSGSTVRTEIVAGLTTFLTMAYIIFVNPSILSTTGMDAGAVFVATCLAAAIGSLIMGLWANYPIALAPGMGLNAYFAFVVVGQMGYSWQVALGAIFISGCLFLLLTSLKIRQWIIDSIPMSMRYAIAAGIGLFLGLIGLKSAGVVVDNPATLVTLGDVKSIEVLLAALGFFIIVALAHLRVFGAVIIGILSVSIIGMLLGVNEFQGVFSAPPSVAPTFLQMDLAGALNVGLITVILAFLFVDLFDTSGTLIGVSQQAKLLDSQGKLPRMGRALMADAGATIAGSVIGTSTTTSYIESTAGTSVGGRTGLTAVVVAFCFLLALFFQPLAGSIPAYATAGALFYIAVLMLKGLTAVDWSDITESAPVVATLILMPLTFSIADGIGLGFICYAAIKLLSGQFTKVSVGVWVIAILFILKYIFLGH